MPKMQYAVFVTFSDGRNWKRFYNKKNALRLAKQFKQDAFKTEVRTMRYNPGPDIWDAPTFYACSERIYPK